LGIVKRVAGWVGDEPLDDEDDDYLDVYGGKLEVGTCEVRALFLSFFRGKMN
jgi:hypothetical protein